MKIVLTQEEQDRFGITEGTAIMCGFAIQGNRIVEHADFVVEDVLSYSDITGNLAQITAKETETAAELLAADGTAYADSVDVSHYGGSIKLDSVETIYPDTVYGSIHSALDAVRSSAGETAAAEAERSIGHGGFRCDIIQSDGTELSFRALPDGRIAEGTVLD